MGVCVGQSWRRPGKVKLIQNNEGHRKKRRFLSTGVKVEEEEELQLCCDAIMISFLFQVAFSRFQGSGQHIITLIHVMLCGESKLYYNFYSSASVPRETSNKCIICNNNNDDTNNNV